MTLVLGSIDQGTTSTRFILFDPNDFYRKMEFSQMDHKQIHPKAGYVEHDPMQILNNTKKCLVDTMKKLDKKKYKLDSVGITNQRETIVLWDKTTGKPLYNAIVWSDLRTGDLVRKIVKEKGKDFVRKETGLPVSTYFSGIKLKWAIENIKDVQDAIKNDKCMFGTIDTWLIWNLTGGVKGGKHYTDVTNASRTMLMNLNTCKWDSKLFKALEIPEKGISFPEIKSCSEDFGTIVNVGKEIDGVRILGCIGDQQSAMVGHQCFQKGMAKNTYGTGCFMLSNVGKTIVESKNGLLTTCLYKFGKEETVYALEGSIPTAGSAVQWLRDNLGFFKSYKELEDLVDTVKDSGGVVFVPAFSGLFAPHWRSDARGTILGITGYTNKGHIIRALLEGVCFQTKEVLHAMEKDSKIDIKILKVDGGMTKNLKMMQIQANLLDVPIFKPKCVELTAIGASICAGLGSGLFKGLENIPKPNEKESQTFSPKIDKKKREERYEKWKLAVTKSMGWSL